MKITKISQPFEEGTGAVWTVEPETLEENQLVKQTMAELNLKAKERPECPLENFYPSEKFSETEKLRIEKAVASFNDKDMHIYDMNMAAISLEAKTEVKRRLLEIPDGC